MNIEFRGFKTANKRNLREVTRKSMTGIEGSASHLILILLLLLLNIVHVIPVHEV